jgi:hypothetical protein
VVLLLRSPYVCSIGEHSTFVVVLRYRCSVPVTLPRWLTIAVVAVTLLVVAFTEHVDIVPLLLLL